MSQNNLNRKEILFFEVKENYSFTLNLIKPICCDFLLNVII